MKKTAIKSSEDKDEFIIGVKGLAEFLKVSIPTARRFKNQLPHYQIGTRTIRFVKSEILEVMSHNHSIPQQ